VTYKTNTEAGSSGSPCFNANWDLVALHHSGDPNFDPGHKPTYNEGIPFSAIANLLHERGHTDKLGEQQL
jgi:V8-like Glu-specific endopeptidase